MTVSFQIEDIDFTKSDGLVPVIVQDGTTFQVLMLGYMNEEALRKTIEEKKLTFFSRSKGRLWTKGESSGNFLTLVALHQDCDSDALLALTTPVGPTCHTGDVSCFSADDPQDLRFLGKLERIIESRASSKDGDTSYTASLFEAGVKRMAQKVGEEGVEVALAAATGDKEEVRNEAADLLYHLQVLLASQDMKLSEICSLLAQRHSRR